MNRWTSSKYRLYTGAEMSWTETIDICDQMNDYLEATGMTLFDFFERLRHADVANYFIGARLDKDEQNFVCVSF